MDKFNIYLPDRSGEKFDICLEDRLTKWDILISSLAFRSSFTAVSGLLPDARMTAFGSDNLVTEHGDAIMIGNVKILV